MIKNEVLKAITDLAQKDQVSKTELLSAYEVGVQMKESSVAEKNPFTLINVLYHVGGGIVALGISVLIGRNWNVFDNTLKIVNTLGIALLLYVCGSILDMRSQYKGIANAFHFIAALILPIGVGVAFDVGGFDVTTLDTTLLMCSILTAFYLLSLLFYRKKVFMIFSIWYCTILFMVFTQWILQTNPYAYLGRVEYRTAIVGMSYMALGYYFSRFKHISMSWWLNGVGVLLFLTSLFFLSHMGGSEGVLWEIILPGTIVGVIFLSVVVRSKAYLVHGALFLVAYIIDITQKYFANSIGWPYALMFIGLCIILIAYATVRIQKKYLA